MKPRLLKNLDLTKAASLMLVSLASLYPVKIQAQPDLTWSPQELRYDSTIKAFWRFITDDPGNVHRQEYIFAHFVLFDYVLADTSQKRVAERKTAFGILLSTLEQFIDSVGLQNLDTKPVRFWKAYSLAYAPFRNGLEKTPAYCLAYFSKKRPGKLLGYLLFDPRTGKLVSWVLIDQGGYYYFLTFNML